MKRLVHIAANANDAVNFSEEMNDCGIALDVADIKDGVWAIQVQPITEELLKNINMLEDVKMISGYMHLDEEMFSRFKDVAFEGKLSLTGEKSCDIVIHGDALLSAIDYAEDMNWISIGQQGQKVSKIVNGFIKELEGKIEKFIKDKMRSLNETN